MSHELRSVVACMAGLTLLAGCAAADSPAAAPRIVATPTATSAPTATAVSRSFVQPSDCTEVLSLSSVATLEGSGLTLLAGPGGKFGDEYLSEPSPEQALGGITCIWGHESTEISSVTISVAPISPASRPGVIANLTDQGLNSEVDGDATVYWQQGDVDHEPAILNFLRAGSWISVIETIGGSDNYDQAELLAADVFESVYE